MIYATTRQRDVSLVRIDSKAHRDSADGTISSATFQYFQYSMYCAELSGQHQETGASASQSTSDGSGSSESGSGSGSNGLDVNFDDPAMQNAIIGSDKQ